MEEHPYAVVERPFWRRWLPRIAGTVLLLLIAFAIRSVYYHRKVASALDEALADLDRSDPGWRLHDIEEARAVIPPEQNSALVCVATSQLLPQGWPNRDFDESLQDLAPASQLSPVVFDRLCKELKAVQPALEEARKLAEMPAGRHRIQFKRNALDTLVEDQQRVRHVSRLLVYDVVRHAQAGEAKAAMTSCRAALNAARSIGDEPFMISQLIRIACGVRVCEAVERTLAQSQPTADGLQRMQQALADEVQHNCALVSARGERAVDQDLFEALENGDLRLSQFAGNERTPPDWQETFLGWRIRDHVRGEHPLMLSLMTRRVAEVQLPLHQQIAAERQFAADILNLPDEAILTRLLLLAVEKVDEPFRRGHACLRCMIVALAVERFRQVRGDWPPTLEKLVPEVLPGVPLDPYDGAPLRYRRLPDGVVVYSIGADCEDNGGNLDRKNPTQVGVDVGYRLWDVKHRRQPPKPVPPPVPPQGAPGEPPPGE